MVSTRETERRYFESPQDSGLGQQRLDAPTLIQMRPRSNTLYVSQGRVAFATQRDGMLVPEHEHGLLVYKSRMLSRYRYLIDGYPWHNAMSSNVHQHSWMGYYMTVAPGVDTGP